MPLSAPDAAAAARMARLAAFVREQQARQSEVETLRADRADRAGGRAGAGRTAAAAANDGVNYLSQEDGVIIDLIVTVLNENVGALKQPPADEDGLRATRIAELVAEKGGDAVDYKCYTWKETQRQRRSLLACLSKLPTVCKDLRDRARRDPRLPYVLAYYRHVSERVCPNDPSVPAVQILPRDITDRKQTGLYDGLPQLPNGEWFAGETLDGSDADRLPAPTGQYGMHPACEQFPTPVPLDPRMEPLSEMPLAAMPRRPMTKERQERMEAYEATTRAIERVTQREEQLADHERHRTLGEIHEAQLQLLPRFTNARVVRTASYPHDTVELEGNWGHNPVNGGDAYDTLQEVLMDRFHTANQLEFNDHPEARAYYRKFQVENDPDMAGVHPLIRQFVGRMRYVELRTRLEAFWSYGTHGTSPCMWRVMNEVGLHAVRDGHPRQLDGTGRWKRNDIRDIALPPDLQQMHGPRNPVGFVPRCVWYYGRRVAAEADAVRGSVSARRRERLKTELDELRDTYQPFPDPGTVAPSDPWNPRTGLPMDYSPAWEPPGWFDTTMGTDGKTGYGLPGELGLHGNPLKNGPCYAADCRRRTTLGVDAPNVAAGSFVVSDSSYAVAVDYLLAPSSGRSANVARSAIDCRTQWWHDDMTKMSQLFHSPVCEPDSVTQSRVYMQRCGYDSPLLTGCASVFCSLACRAAYRRTEDRNQLRAVKLDWDALERALPWNNAAFAVSAAWKQTPSADMLFRAQLQLHKAIRDSLLGTDDANATAPLTARSATGAAGTTGPVRDDVLAQQRQREIDLLNVHLGVLAAADALEHALCEQQKIDHSHEVRVPGQIKSLASIPGVTMTVENFCRNANAAFNHAAIANVKRVYDQARLPGYEQHLVCDLRSRPRPNWIHVVQQLARERKVFTS